ncbi:hypothetical protein PCANC_14597 [Puccinia coronata f. sp. avenae]|uniref:Uncharacterized protein n=1 Tax=Puccinia coronata f. sp. avenae TaxID=200324 RepID=A0A2N5UG81_9BASI|nr:hypothetical protein PCANC_14597 [Puccinia coronata f. sp. avenae]
MPHAYNRRAHGEQACRRAEPARLSGRRAKPARPLDRRAGFARLWAHGTRSTLIRVLRTLIAGLTSNRAAHVSLSNREADVSPAIRVRSTLIRGTSRTLIRVPRYPYKGTAAHGVQALHALQTGVQALHACLPCARLLRLGGRAHALWACRYQAPIGLGANKGSDSKDGHDALDDDGLYTDWPPLSPIGLVDTPTEELQGLFVLDDNHIQLAHRLMQASARLESQWQVTVMTMVSILHMVRPGGPGVILAPEMTHGAHNYLFSSNIRAFLRKKIREIFTTGNVYAYNRTQSMAGLPLTQTPLVLLNAHLEDQTLDFRSKNLPPEWPCNHISCHSVLTLMRVLLKHERGALRNLLLTNVKVFNQQAINGPVPNLMNLILIINCAMGGRDELRSLAQVRTAYTATMKIRIAFIRLAVIHHYLNPDPASTLTQWDIIDHQLEHIRRQSEHFRNVHSRMVVEKDQELFTGVRELGDIPRDSICLPDNQDVHLKMSRALRTNPDGASTQRFEECYDHRPVRRGDPSTPLILQSTL